MPEAQKSPAQVKVDALNRKRKPLIKFDEKPAEQLLKAKDVQIESLSRQIKTLQHDLTHKEAYIRELEDKVRDLQSAPKVEPQPQTEEVPGQPGQRRTRRAAAAPTPQTVVVENVIDPKAVAEHLDKNPEIVKKVIEGNPEAAKAVVSTTEPPKPVKPGDGIPEED